MGRTDLDDRGRPVVVVTGTGVLTSLGTGRHDNWRELTAGALGHSAHLALPDRRPAHHHRRHSGLRAGRRAVGAGAVRAARRTGHRGGRRRSRHRHAGRLPRTDVPGPAAGGDGVAAAPRPRRGFRRERYGRVTTTCCAPRRPGSSRASTSGSCSARWPRTWRCGSAPRARRLQHRPPAPPAAPRSSSASRRSAAARPRRRWWSAPTPR